MPLEEAGGRVVGIPTGRVPGVSRPRHSARARWPGLWARVSKCSTPSESACSLRCPIRREPKPPVRRASPEGAGVTAAWWREPSSLHPRESEPRHKSAPALARLPPSPSLPSRLHLTALLLLADDTKGNLEEASRRVRLEDDAADDAPHLFGRARHDERVVVRREEHLSRGRWPVALTKMVGCGWGGVRGCPSSGEAGGQEPLLAHARHEEWGEIGVGAVPGAEDAFAAFARPMSGSDESMSSSKSCSKSMSCGRAVGVS